MKKLLLALLCLFMLVGCSGETADVPEEEKVFNVGILQLLQHDALDSATQGFKDALTDLLGDRVVFDEQNASGDAANCATIANQFVANGVDLIFANATPALQASKTATGDIPIVGTSVTSFKVALDMNEWNGLTGINVTGTSDLAPLDQQAAQVLEIVPDAKTVAIFFCSAEPNSVFQADEIEKHFAAMGIETQRFTFADSNDIAQVAINASDWADVVYIPTDNTAASYATADQFSKPCVVGEAGMCKKVGCVTISIAYYDIGYRAGEMAYEILVNGADPATMKVEEVTKTTKMFNPEVCEKFGIEVTDEYVSVLD
ncbi:MAG: ABC transporter substrate-binding protein [Erysipelotrichaceae bacterium]|nr:ABC transporter substrate-binding protein [Erysipelotrichaceae bacterium]